MRKTILNASLEESMNLVTDKYIHTCLEESKHKKIIKKIFGGLFILLVMYLFSFMKFYIRAEGVTFLFLDINIPFLVLISLAFIAFIMYIYKLFSIKNYNILAYYYYMKSFSLLTLLFYLQLAILSIAGAGIVLGNLWSNLIYGIFYLIIFIERYIAIKKHFLDILYGDSGVSNKFMDVLEHFTNMSKRYGGFIILIIVILRFFMTDDIYRNGFTRTIGLLGFPFVIGFGFYLVLALIMDSFPGYYLQKYLEDYRQLSGYSLEEWYGPKSQKYKESLKK